MLASRVALALSAARSAGHVHGFVIFVPGFVGGLRRRFATVPRTAGLYIPLNDALKVRAEDLELHVPFIHVAVCCASRDIQLRIVIGFASVWGDLLAQCLPYVDESAYRYDD
eukprot:1048787-Prymnesium_polylepis.1